MARRASSARSASSVSGANESDGAHGGEDEDRPDRNEVVLVGRLAAAPILRELPSGDRVLSFRVVVRRPAGDRRRPGSPTVDALECAAWRAGARRSVQAWCEGDVVQVSGALRRRFWRTGGVPASVWEIEVAQARRLARAA